MKKTNNIKISYEPEADILMWELSNQSIDFAKEAGNIIVHFNREGIPVLVEILEASKFLHTAENLLQNKNKISKETLLTTK